MKKLVSAIITTHNRIELLKKAIESVRNQTYSNIEIIVVNDNSSDGTTELLNSIEGIKHIYISAEESRGGNYARNLGIKNSVGEYLAFLDDDDEWMPEKIQNQVNIMMQHPDVGFVYCGHIVEVNFLNRNENYVEDYMPQDMSKKCFEKIFCTTSMILVRQSIIQKIGGFDENLKFWQEYDLCIRIAQIAQIAAIPEPQIILRVIDSDKGRLTNKYDGWLEAVNYVSQKYDEVIKKLPDNIRKNRELMILREKAYRCEKAGRKKEKRRILYQIWRITGKPKHFLKFILNTAKFYRT